MLQSKEKLLLDIEKLKEVLGFYATPHITQIADVAFPNCADYDFTEKGFIYGKKARDILKEME